METFERDPRTNLRYLHNSPQEPHESGILFYLTYLFWYCIFATLRLIYLYVFFPFFDILSLLKPNIGPTLNYSLTRTVFIALRSIFCLNGTKHEGKQKVKSERCGDTKKDLREKLFRGKDESFVCLSVAGDSSGLKWAWRMYKI